MNIYIHIPFCAHNCSYCTFRKVISIDANMHQLYFEALKKEFVECLTFKPGATIKTLYFGGGTPSLISADILTDFFAFLKQKYVFSSDIEIALECHPASITEEKLEAWQACGIHRISLGVQTLQTKFDVFLERNLSHTQGAIELLSHYSFRLSADFIFGFPGQTKKDLAADIEAIKKLPFEHISFYALDYKVGSKIESQEDLRLDFTTLTQFYHNICISLGAAGFEQYEVYNFAKNKAYSQHNVNFWNGEDYLGFGLSAVSGMGNLVRENTVLLPKYLQGEYLDIAYNMTLEEELETFLKRRLRLSNGVNIQGFTSFCLKRGLGEMMERVLENAKTIFSWIQFSQGAFFLTEEGKMNFLEVMDVLMIGIMKE